MNTSPPTERTHGLHTTETDGRSSARHAAYFIQNDPVTPPGTFVDWARDRRFGVTLVELDKGAPLPNPRPGDAVIVFGGIMGANDTAAFPYLAALRAAMRNWAYAGVHQLGICLGGQLLAAALGGPVLSRQRGEAGAAELCLTEAGASDALFCGLPRSFACLVLHDDSFELPGGAVLLGGTSSCPHQAFRWGNSWGLQFHPEVNSAIIATWVAGLGRDSERGRRVEDGFRSIETGYLPHARRLLDNFLDEVRHGAR